MRVASAWRQLGVALLGVALAGFAHPAERDASLAGAEQPLVLDPETARVAALGFDALMSDYHWLEAVQLVGAADAAPSRHGPLIQRLVGVVTSLDPWVDHPYRFAALFLTDSPQDVRAGNRILERGIAYHPLEWRNRFYLSFNDFFFLGDEQAAARELEPAIGLEHAPPYLGRLLARLRSDTGGLDAAAAYLQELLRGEPDGFRRAEYEKALDEIETERRARFLDAARERFRTRSGRDIARVEELAEGPDPVLRALPPELHGWEWVLDAKSGRIVSSYYQHRYELALRADDRARRDAWARQTEAEAAGGSAGPKADAR
jgi:hypothetical protein